MFLIGTPTTGSLPRRLHLCFNLTIAVSAILTLESMLLGAVASSRRFAAAGCHATFVNSKRQQDIYTLVSASRRPECRVTRR